MSRAVRIKDHWREQRLFSTRTLIAIIVAAFLTSMVMGRLFYLQVIKHRYYSELSQGNRVRLEPMPPDRGLIYDRTGAVLAENTPAYELELTPEQVPDIPDTLQRLSALGLIETDQIPSLARVIRASRKFSPVPLRLSLSETDIATFSVRQYEFPGVEIRTRLARWYPFGESAVHALGYVGIISEDDLKHIDRDEYGGSALIGKSGLESAYEKELHGAAGQQQVVVNAQGRHVDSVGGVAVPLENKPPRGGNDLILGIDMRIQHIAESALSGRRGAVVALDPNNGNIVALVSTPTFDPNKFTRGISTKDYVALRDDIDKPLFDRALRGTYPPGSTIKPFMGLAGLEYGAIEPSTARNCHGGFTLPGSSHVYRDWKKEGHGTVDMRRAIATSCDVYFYGLAEALGIDHIHTAMSELGFGNLTGIDISGERPGLVPSPAWKQQAYKQTWYPGETVIVGIGQGYLLTTPLQLAHATGIIATHGKNFRPRLVTAVRDAVTRQVNALPPLEDRAVTLKDPSHWNVILEGMEKVMEPGGTGAASARGAPYRMAGKSGTAQVFNIGQNQKYDAGRVSERLRDHALFIVFAPAESPKLVVAVLVENGGHGGSAAAPIARRVLDAYLLGKYDVAGPAPIETAADPQER